MATLRKKNTILSLKVNGEAVYGKKVISKVISHYYMELFKEPFVERPQVEGLSFNKIFEKSVAWLERPSSKHEVLEALKSLQEEKTLGPTGFPMRSFMSSGIT